MIFKITIDEHNPELCRLLKVEPYRELHFAVIGYECGFYYLDGLFRPFRLCAWKRNGSWCLQDVKGIFDTAHNVKIEIVDSFPTPN